MSKRMMNKIVEYRQQNKKQQEEEEQLVQPVRQQKSFFNSALLNMDSDSQEDKEETISNIPDQEPQEQNIQQQKPKQKKKNKKNKKLQQEFKSSQQQQKEDDNDVYLDKQIQKVEEESKQQPSTLSSKNYCLEINLSRLNYNKELSKHFKNLKASEDNQKQNKGQHVKGNRANMKANKLVHNPDLKMNPTQRFSCEPADINDYGIRIFKFVGSSSYESLQKEYQIVKNSMNPQQIFDFLHYHPQHCDALFDVGEYYRLKGDYKQANDILELLIYIYELSLGFEFGKILTEGPITMELEINTFSLTFLKTLQKFTDILDKKGCYKSALEFNKVLIKCNPSTDQTGALLILDYHALCSSQYDYLCTFTGQFCQEVYKNSKYSILFMPNYIYNCALAKFLKQRENDEQKEDQPNPVTEEDYNRAISNLNGVSSINENCNVLLIQAILLYPSAIMGMAIANEYAKQHSPNPDSFIKNQRKPFKEILDFEFINRETYFYWFLGLENDDDSAGLKKVIDIFIERNKKHWKHQYISQWVRGIIGFIQNKIDDVVLNLMTFYEQISCQQEKQPLANLIPFLFRRYKGLIKIHFSDQTERLDFNNLFAENMGDQQQPVQHPNYRAIAPNQGILGVLMNSLLPWVHNPEAQHAQGRRRHQNQNQDQGEVEDDFEDDL